MTYRVNYRSHQDELYHHGILGMKWGVRRFQNPDGTLTELGKKRYGTEERFNRHLAYKQKQKETAIKVAKIVGIAAATTTAAVVGHSLVTKALQKAGGKVIAESIPEITAGTGAVKDRIIKPIESIIKKPRIANPTLAGILGSKIPAKIKPAVVDHTVSDTVFNLSSSHDNVFPGNANHKIYDRLGRVGHVGKGGRSDHPVIYQSGNDIWDDPFFTKPHSASLSNTFIKRRKEGQGYVNNVLGRINQGMVIVPHNMDPNMFFSLIGMTIQEYMALE